MGRKRVIRREPMTSVSLYLADAIYIEKFQRLGETRPEAIRRILSAFDEPGHKQAMREAEKKLIRQQVKTSGDQVSIDNPYFTHKTLKDLTYSHAELMDMIIQDKGWHKDPLAKRNADDSINKALQRGDCSQRANDLGVLCHQIIRKWW